MELTRAFRRFAAARPHALMAVAPGGTEARLAVEWALRERDWPVASSPADADLLVVCGKPMGSLAEAVERVWGQLPAPRGRVEIGSAADVDRVLGGAQALLAAHGEGGRRGDAVPEASGPPEHGGHGGGHGGGGLVAGVALAERAPDRDGLMLDRLELPLGPILMDWPAGLVLRTAVQGDVVQDAKVELVGAETTAEPFWSEPWLRAARGEPVTRGEAARRLAAAHLDSLGRLLALAGAERHALTVRGLRDGLVAGLDRPAAATAVDRLGGALRRSGLLRWSLAGLGDLDAGRAEELGIGGPALRAAGDVWDRALRWLDEAEAAISVLDDGSVLDGEAPLEGPRGLLDGPEPPSRAFVDALPELVTGTELAGARLIVASLDPDVDELTAATAVAGG